MHVFQLSGTVAQGGQVSCPRTHSWVGADTGGSTLSWDHHACPHTHTRTREAQGSPLMQPTSSLMSSQSYSLSHCRLPWTQVPSEHWNSSGRQVVTAGKGRAGGGEEGGRMVKAAVAQQADTGLGAVCAQGLFRPGTPHLASFSRRPAAHPSYLLFKADKRGKRWASFPPLRKNFPNTPVFVF